MGKNEINDIVSMIPKFLLWKNIWTLYDKEADVLYVEFKKPSSADETEMTDDDIIIRYENGEIIGLTVLNAGKRNYV
ncbi:MAG: hypothetical protein A2033_08810 [Bacteroidetes bacterium GWA2_31_9]|nr:MAG: hypothetical protein A2033_08810 [Bacteroidetes bacterium GWA2_31_9]